MLARHLSCATTATAVYSRDLLSPVMREMDNMLRAIRCQMFHPDKSRSGLVTPAAMPVVPGTPFAIPQAPLPSTPVPPAEKFPVEEKRSPASGPEIAASEAEPEKLSEDQGSWHHLSFDGDGCDVASVGIADSETSEEDSVQSTSDSEGEQSVSEPKVFQEPFKRYFLNTKSLVIHCERSEGILRCGRKVSPHFVTVWELNGIRCSRCFDV